MPNWCSNSITIRHSDPAMIQRVLDAKEGVLSEFIPCPKELTDTVAGHLGDGYAQELNQFKMQLNIKYFGAKDWYDWQVSNWGTKWDITFDGVERTDENTVQASFESAWAPPIGAYEKLCAMGFEIEAYYYEPGMCFVGKFTGNRDDVYDDYYEYGGHDSETVRDVIGAELDDYFNISEEMAQYEEEERENE